MAFLSVKKGKICQKSRIIAYFIFNFTTNGWATALIWPPFWFSHYFTTACDRNNVSNFQNLVVRITIGHAYARARARSRADLMISVRITIKAYPQILIPIWSGPLVLQLDMVFSFINSKFSSEGNHVRVLARADLNIYQGYRARNEDNLNLNFIDFWPSKDAKYDKTVSRSPNNLILE